MVPDDNSRSFVISIGLLHAQVKEAQHPGAINASRPGSSIAEIFLERIFSRGRLNFQPDSIIFSRGQ